MKKDALRVNNETLVPVPFWWNGDPDSLAASIWFQRPDLLSCPNSLPISFSPPNLLVPTVPGVGELMLASFLPNYDQFTLPEETSWWMGEKYDGIRVCWNPIFSQLYSKSGNEIMLPLVVTKQFGNIMLDGEIWFGRSNFADALKIIHKHFTLVDSLLRYIPFDVPDVVIQKESFEKRYQFMLEQIPNNTLLIPAMRMLCLGNKHMKDTRQKIIEKGGEGIILRRVGSLYEPGRSDSLIKLKNARGDMEGIVVAIDSDNVQLKLPNGEMAVVPSTNLQITNLKAGDIVSFFYETYSSKILVNPVIYRIRTDVSWDEVVYNFENEQQFNSEQLTQRHRAKAVKNLKSHLENYAKENNLDPLKSDTWMNLSPNDVFKSKSERALYHQFWGKGYLKTLRHLFPEVSFDSKQAFCNTEERRKFFEKYAQTYGFDPYNPDNWNLQRHKLYSVEEVKQIASYYGNSLSKALWMLFPEIGMNKKWAAWDTHENRRQFFEQKAKELGFDPLVAENWYLNKSKLQSFKEVNRIRFHYNGSIANTLMDLFPEIGLQKSKLNPSWNDPENRKLFFENFARENNFDPLIAANWYIQAKKLLSVKEVDRVRYYYNGSISRALIDLFPDIGLDSDNLIKSFKNRFNN